MNTKPGRLTNLDLLGYIDDLYPASLGVLVAMLWMLFGPKLVMINEDHKWHLDQIYTAMFGFLAITTGFLATFYGTIQSVSAGFIDKLRSTRAFGSFMHYVRNAIILGLITSMLSVLMMIVTPLPKESLSISGVATAIWIGLVVWSLLGFYRVSRWFFFLLETRVPPSHPGG